MKKLNQMPCKVVDGKYFYVGTELYQMSWYNVEGSDGYRHSGMFPEDAIKFVSEDEVDVYDFSYDYYESCNDF